MIDSPIDLCDENENSNHVENISIYSNESIEVEQFSYEYMEKTINSFHKFLIDHKIDTTNNKEKKKFTHTRVGFPSGSYCINQDNQDDQIFLNEYIKVLKIKNFINSCDDTYEHKNDINNLLKKRELYDFNFSEAQKNIGPLLFDFDFEFSLNSTTDIKYTEEELQNFIDNVDENENMKHIYKNYHVSSIIRAVNNIICDNFIIDEKQLLCYLIEKESPTVNRKNNEISRIKDGFHFIYQLPFTIEQRTFIHTQLVKYLEDTNKLKDIGFTNAKGYKDIVDSAVIHRNNWMLYKSYKTLGGKISPLYICKYYYTSRGKRTKVNYDEYELVKIFSVRQYNDEIIEYNDNYKKKYIIDNVSLADCEINTKKEIVSKNSHFSQFDLNKTNEINYYRTSLNNNSVSYEIIKGLLNILDPYRVDDYNDWMRIGWSIYSVNPSDPKLYEIFDEYSQQSSKYDEKSCKKVWERAKINDKSLSIATLRYFAKIDNLNAYYELNKTHSTPLMDKIIKDCTDTDIAEYVYNKYCDFFVCSSIEQKTWYVFRDHRWQVSEHGTDLRSKISEEVAIDFEDKLKQYNVQLNEKAPSRQNIQLNMDTISETEKTLKKNDRQYQLDMKSFNEERNSMIKKFVAINKKLKDVAPLNKIMEACCHKFYSNRFEDKLDQNAKLIGFKDGVYDLESREFRPGLPEDYISLSTEYNYPIYTGNESVFNDLNNYFDNLFKAESIKHNNTNIRDYVLRYVASRLEGQNINNQFNIWTGGASNGKSVFTDLISKTFGEYYGVLENTIITQKRSAIGQATPELAMTRGKRIITIQEPESNAELKVGFIKQLSGGQDKITARALYKNAITFIPQFEIILICNQIPTLSNNDQGIMRRLSVVNFSTTFVSYRDPDESKGEVKADMDVPNYVKSGIWAPPFMWLLLNRYYDQYKEIGLQKPNEVTLTTSKYIDESDECTEFISDKYVINPSSLDGYIPVDFNNFYIEYAEWYKCQNYSRNKQKTKLKLKNHITNILKYTINKDNIIETIYMKDDFDDDIL